VDQGSQGSDLCHNLDDCCSGRVWVGNSRGAGDGDVDGGDEGAPRSLSEVGTGAEGHQAVRKLGGLR